MAIYYQTKQFNYMGKGIKRFLYIYDDSKPYDEAFQILNNKPEDLIKREEKDLKRQLGYDTFIGPYLEPTDPRIHPLLFFSFHFPRTMGKFDKIRSDKTLKELKQLANEYDKGNS